MKKFCSKVTKLTVPMNFRKNDESRNRRSGSYDVEEAQKVYDQTRNCHQEYCASDTSDTTSDYEDARTVSDKNSVLTENEVIIEKSRNLDCNNSQFEYDVPRISFRFFEKKEEDYELVVPKIVKTEVKIILKEPKSDEITERIEEIEEKDREVDEIDGKVEEINIAIQEMDKQQQEPDGKMSELYLFKSGSDPTFSKTEDNFYQVPRQLQVKRNRLSQSMNDFSIDIIETITTQPSIEHVSCSQILPQNSAQTSQDSSELDYCKTRSKLKIFLKKPKKAVDTWNSLKEKFDNLMAEQAAQQRVGAYNDKEKLTINFEEMYKNSKCKCKKALKIFSRTKNLENNEESEEKQKPLTASDIEYKFNVSSENSFKSVEQSPTANYLNDEAVDEENRQNFDFASLRTAFRRKFVAAEGQNGFEDLRRYVKQGGDFCKELASILQERAEAETQYAKSLSKLSLKLSRACRENVGSINEAWKQVAVEMESRAECHRLCGTALLEETARPLRTLSENQHRTRKQCETGVDKAGRLLADWRAAEAKGKKNSHSCARDNEKLQDAAVLDTSKSGKLTLSRSTSLIQLAHMHNKTVSDKETAKLEGKKRKAEDAVKKADIEYYTLCVRAERARLEWESAVLRGVNTFQSLEEERLNHLKTVLNAYIQHGTQLGPRLVDAAERLKSPVLEAEPAKDLTTFVNLRQTSQQVSEQLLPDFYCEHITLAMNRERRKQALVKLLHLIRQDLERERKSKNGLENLSKAIKKTPNFGAEDSQQSVSEKLYHMKSMLTYLEGARYKVHNALAELDSRPRAGHPLAPHISITRDKSGLQQSVLKVPQWLKEEWLDPDKSPVSEKSLKSDNSDQHSNDLGEEWTDRGAADGNSNQPDSDFDEFSSHSSGGNNIEEIPVQPIAQCKALYAYTPNLTDELALRPGDLLSVYRQQDDGWWLGECGGNVGIFPATYVELLH